jgi:hypothetical protein
VSHFARGERSHLPQLLEDISLATNDPTIHKRTLVIIMQNNIRECLERAAECARLAERVDHTELKLYLTKLATSWTKVAAEVIEAQSRDTNLFPSSAVSEVDRVSS